MGKPKNEKIDEIAKEIQYLIRKKYGKQKYFAEELKMSEQDLANRIKVHSPEFMEIIKGKGIVLKDITTGDQSTVAGKQYNINQGSLEIDRLNKTIDSLNKYIRTLEQENENLKKRVSE